MAIKTTSEFKKELITLLINNPTIVELIDNPDIETPDELINKNIFPRLKIDFVPEDASTYIGLKVDYPSITSNEAIRNCVMTFLIISHKSHIKTITGDSRTDLLAEELIKMFNWNYTMGFTSKLVKDVEDPFDTNYYYRRLTFTKETTNNLENKINNGVRNG